MFITFLSVDVDLLRSSFNRTLTSLTSFGWCRSSSGSMSRRGRIVPEIIDCSECSFGSPISISQRGCFTVHTSLLPQVCLHIISNMLKCKWVCDISWGSSKSHKTQSWQSTVPPTQTEKSVRTFKIYHILTAILCIQHVVGLDISSEKATVGSANDPMGASGGLCTNLRIPVVSYRPTSISCSYHWPVPCATQIPPDSKTHWIQP